MDVQRRGKSTFGSFWFVEGALGWASGGAGSVRRIDAVVAKYNESWRQVREKPAGPRRFTVPLGAS